MLSQKTRYALKSLVLLAESERQKRGPVLISELARRGKMPQKFLEAILLELKNRGILQSKKGKGGGYSLAKRTDEITLGSVIRMFEGPLALIPCVSQNLPHRCSECDDEETFGLRILFKEVRDATSNILDNTSLAKIQQVQAQAKDNKKAMYFI
jgi:Rrf2 family protein